jgi:molybdate transport system substrate-binding protein
MVGMIVNGGTGLAGKRIRDVWLALLLAEVMVLAACGSGGGQAGEETSGGGGGEQGGTLTVFGAASLTDAFGELATTFEEENQGTEVRTSFGASSEVLAQIQQGAPADVFASADEAKMNTAVDDGLVAGEPQTFVRNRLTIVVPKDNPAGIESYEDLAEPGLRLVLAEDDVPVAEYAKESLQKANAEYGADFERRVLDNIVSREADVRAGANRVVLGEADATFGYTSDVTPDIRDRVGTVEIPSDLNVIATYPIAVLEEAESPVLAKRWVELVTSDEGQQVLEEWGFEPAS